MTPDRLLSHFDRVAEAPAAVPRLRRFILDLAVRGKLVEQDPNDEPASELLNRIQVEKERLVNAGKIKKQGALPNPGDNERPFTLPNTWEWRPFADVAAIQSNLVNPRDYPDALHIAPDNIESGTGRLLPYESIRDSKVYSSKHRFFSGCILYSKIRPSLAKAVIVDFEGLCSADMYPILPMVSRRFLHTYMLSETFIQQSLSEDNRVAMPKINQASLSKILVTVPPLAEQERIVAKVDELMALCDRLEAAQAERERRRDRLAAASLHRLNHGADAHAFHEHARFHLHHLPRLTTRPEHIQQLRQSILSLAVCGKLVPQDPNDEPASELLAKKTKLPDEHQRRRKILKKTSVDAPEDLFPVIPPSWEYTDVQTLYDLNVIIDYSDGNHGSLYPRSNEFGDSGVTFATARDLANGRVMWDSCARLKEERAKQLTKGWAQGGDVLLTHNATVGRVARVEPEVGRFLLGTSVTFYRLNSKVMDPGFFYSVLRSPLWQGQLEAIMAQTTRNQVSIQKQAFFRIAVPPLAEQHRIVAKVDELMALCDRLEAQLTISETESRRLLEAVLHEALLEKGGRDSDGATGSWTGFALNGVANRL